MRQLRYFEQAKNDLIEVRRYIAQRSDDEVALTFVRKLRSQCKRLAKLPGELGRARPELRDGLRSFAYDNYVIFFIYNGDFLNVVTIIEGHRDVAVLVDEGQFAGDEY